MGWYARQGMDLLELLDRPTYTVTEVARWARTTPQTARRWMDGYQHHGDRWSEPVTSRRREAPFLSFEDLIEVAIVAAIRREHISMARIRRAADYAQEVLGVDRPLVALRLKTDGRELFLHDAVVRAGYTNLTRFGQVAAPIIEDVLRDVEYEAETASRWWPIGQHARILIDPRVNFGRPIVADLGVRTETLLDRWAGGDTIESLAGEFRATPALIERALQFENRALSAA
jgi:uncharacterized protein (DUF433 family)